MYLQSDREYNFVLLPSTLELVLLFSILSVAIVGIVLFMARDIIFGKKMAYDDEDLSSKIDRDYEKYHSDWHDDYYDDRRLDVGEDLPDYYGILGVDRQATQDQIKERYRALVKELHPDLHRAGSSEQKMAEINEAYETLSDADRRKEYDASLI